VNFNIFGFLAGLIFAGSGIYLRFRKPKGNNYETELNELLSKYSVTSIEKLSALVSSYTALSRQIIPAATVRDAARQSYDSANAAFNEAERKAISQLSEFMPDVTSGQDVIDAISKTEDILEKLTKAEFDMRSCQSVYETLVGNYDGDPEADDIYLPVPLRSKEDTAAALERTNAQLSDAVHNFDLATGRQHSLGDPAVIEGEIQSLNDKISEELHRYDALSMAIDTLSDANTELQTRFSPLVSRKASEIMAKLTDDRYEHITFDKGFNANTKTSDDTVTRNILSLSDGTVDEIYFSLRLAMCELILGGDDPCPIILDDALINFDDERCKRALNLLLELSEDRQIILFSCHSREAQFMSGVEGANIING
jgi:DNA repair exonuclease SbcCD ATPase subunit